MLGVLIDNFVDHTCFMGLSADVLSVYKLAGMFKFGDIHDQYMTDDIINHW